MVFSPINVMAGIKPWPQQCIGRKWYEFRMRSVVVNRNDNAYCPKGSHKQL